MSLANHRAWKGLAPMQTVTGVVADISPPSASSKRPNVTPAERKVTSPRLAGASTKGGESNLNNLVETRQLPQMQCAMKSKRMFIPCFSLPIAAMTPYASLLG